MMTFLGLKVFIVLLCCPAGTPQQGPTEKRFFEELQAVFLNNSDEIADKSRLAEGCPISAME
jgi:hypothetical protein